MSNKKIWALMLQMSTHFAYAKSNSLPLDDSMWNYMIENAAKSGFNTILLEVNDGVELASHPEIALPGAWSRTRLREEIKKCNDLGLTVIPKFNFSAGHCLWLGKYSRMISTDIYYQVCNDIIKEAYELFNHPEYIHIGMDEEDEEHARYNPDGYCMFRRGELYWHDLRFLLDCVKDTGAKPWMWYDPTLGHNPHTVDDTEYRAHVGLDEAMLSPWYYDSFDKSKFRLVKDYEYDFSPYELLNLTYVEEIPKYVDFRENIINHMHEGYSYIPCSWARNKGNTYDIMELFTKAPKDKYFGQIVSTWCMVQEKNREVLENALTEFKKAKDTFYPDEK